MTLRIAALVSAALFAGPAFTQSLPPPPCESEIYRAFDFWLGTWEVTTPDGASAGVNEISSKENGCLILEAWSSAGGSTGQSYNYYDPGMGKWRQIWVSGSATIDYAGGLNEDGAMVLEGEIAYRTGQTFPFRGSWTPEEDGAVTQHFRQYNPETEEWADWFIGVYRKRE